ncbi:MAG TPA: SDR family oxidoreductase [Sphingomonadaceae bacterium]|jgi:NAD(P)-dependent dehydrogenase (short-subunit alcohol dehydrogenase family)|nr:SDR family oxidoreductase [Sphingomonadaceae bacterium]
MGTMQGEVALVTGGGRGFGRAIAERFAAEGARVGVVSRSRDELDEVVRHIRQSGGTAFAATADVTDPDQVARAVGEVREALGPISRLVSNAGVPGPFGPLWVTKPEDWWRSQHVHILAPYLFLRHVLPDMVERDRGRVILVSALASRMTLGGLSAYSVGKAAQNKMVAMVADELKDTAVKIFAIDPGFVITQLARDTYASPDAQKYLPHMMHYLDEGADRPDADADLGRCAQRCVDLFSGRYDLLSGRYMELPDDIDTWVEEAKAGATTESAA